MTVGAFIAELRARGVDIALEPTAAGDAVRLRGSKDALSEERLAFLRAHKQEIVAALKADAPPPPRSGPAFSLFFFSGSASNRKAAADGYRLLVEAARFADEHGFEAIWTPERHFHDFGGLYPNPSVTAAALAMITRRVRLRAGSVVLPLHDPVRVAEEWSVVDHLSDGRIDIAVAKGFSPNDFALAPSAYRDRSSVLVKNIEELRRLWRGEAVRRRNGAGAEIDLAIKPPPTRADLAIWIAVAESDQSFQEAGALGANLLTSLLRLTPERLAEKIRLYKEARAANGHAPEGGAITVMAHAFVHEEEAEIEALVREPFTAYLRESADLWRSAFDIGEMSEAQQSRLVDYAYKRYRQGSSLIGSPDSCLSVVDALARAGATEIACLIDFGVDVDVVLKSLPALSGLRRASAKSYAALEQRSVRSEGFGPRPKDEPSPLTMDGAALAPLPLAAATLGVSREQVVEEWLGREPRVVATLETWLGRIGIIALPFFVDELVARREDVIDSAVAALVSADRSFIPVSSGAVSLTGLLPGLSAYGRAIAEKGKVQGARCVVTNGHGFTVAAITMTAARLLAEIGRPLERESVAIVGLGSIGMGIARLLLARGARPEALILSDLVGREPAVRALAQELSGSFDAPGTIALALGNPGSVHEEVYGASVILGASSAPDVIDVERLRPGTVLIDDSAPRCFSETAAIRRFEARGDILFTEAGSVELPRPLTVSVLGAPPTAPARMKQAIATMIAPHESTLTACVLSCLATAIPGQAGAQPTLGAVDLSSSVAAYRQLEMLGCRGAMAHSNLFRFPKASLERFRDRFGAATVAAAF